jgi:hypothetical protein
MYDKPSHCILNCYGTATSDFSFEVVDIKTGEVSTIFYP